jgi:hypothetical protein
VIRVIPASPDRRDRKVFMVPKATRVQKETRVKRANPENPDRRVFKVCRANKA